MPGDSEPPAKQTDLIIEQREEKQKAVHKATAQQLCQIWNGKSYNDHPVASMVIPMPDEPNDVEKRINDFLEAGICHLREDEALLAMQKEFAFLLRHTNRSSDLLSFVKCSDKSCTHCVSHPL